MISVDVSLLLPSVTDLFVPVVFAIDVFNNLEVEVTLLEEGIVVELMEMGKDNDGKTTFMFTGMNLHS